MKRFVFPISLAALLLPALFACQEEPRNTEPLVDPWTRERTPVNLRLESQIGAAVISDDWRNDGEGSIVVSLITSGLDMSAVKVEALDFKFPDSEFCPKASVSPGGTLDFSSGTASFVVTAYNGETRTYTVSYTQFSDPLEGTYTFTPVAGILDGSAPKCAFIIVGGWDDAVVRSTVMDKWWHWGTGYMPTDEDDNTLSFRLEKADPETGATFGTLVNTPGDDGKYANYLYNNSIDVNDKYRIFPAGRSRWAKPGDGSIVVYDYADADYANPLYSVELIEAGNHEYAGVNFDVPNLAFGRAFEGPFDVIDWNWPDTRWFTDNVRNTFWLVKKDSDSPIADHSDYLAEQIMRRALHTLLALLAFAGALACACDKPAPEEPESKDTRHLSFAQANVEIGYDRTAFSVSVDANFEYTVDIQADWISADPDRTSTASKQYFIAQKNAAASARTATLRFADKSDRYYAKDVTVTQAANPVQTVSLTIVDKDATPETKALLANLWAIADTGWMFGHHDDLWYGRYWYDQAGNSDTKAVCGDYPGVFSVDFAEIMDDRHASSANAIRRRVILEARERGEVILACAHLNNPKTGGDSWDNSSKEVVKEILTVGTGTRTRYLQWLDRCADFALNLKDSRGKLVPVIFRMYHEHTQGWSWWGSSCTTASEFVELWQFTVKYLRDTKGVHSFLYAVSPQMDEVYSDAQGRILFRWPGDEWVDFIGMDCYHGTNDKAFESNVKALEAVSLEKRKPCGVTEDGKESFTETDFWTRHVLAPVGDRRISMVTMWRNKYVGGNESDKHYFSVYPGHLSEADFRKMYDDKRSLFSRDLPDMYTLPQGYEIK